MRHGFDTSQIVARSCSDKYISFSNKKYARESQDLRLQPLADLDPLASALGIRFAKTLERYDYKQANQELSNIHAQLCIADLNLCESTDELKHRAQECAKLCRIARQDSWTEDKAYGQCLAIVARYQISPPYYKSHYDLIPALNRMCCEHWWFRQIKKLRLRRIDAVARNIEIVNRSNQLYVSDYTVKLKRQQTNQNRLYLSSTSITNEKGESYLLQDLVDRSVSNPAIRRAELMTRINGFEVVANLLEHVGEFYTLTTPSRMHACLHDGQENPKYDGTTVKQAQDYLTYLWALIRSELFRQGIKPYGFRVAEPHHDGTPHWHLLLFMPKEHSTKIRAVIQHYALLDSPEEAGAKTYRFKAIGIDRNRGSAAGYIAKYIAKNIDGYSLNNSPEDKTANARAERITTWASTWGIRQFQQIGGASVTVWRQLRRLDAVDDEKIEQLRQTATASNWAAFTLAMGGIDLSRKQQALKPYYDYSQQLVPHTGEIIQIENNRYGGAARKKAVGVCAEEAVYDTRKHFWTLQSKTADSSLKFPSEACEGTGTLAANGSNPAGGVPLVERSGGAQSQENGAIDYEPVCFIQDSKQARQSGINRIRAAIDTQQLSVSLKELTDFFAAELVSFGSGGITLDGLFKACEWYSKYKMRSLESNECSARSAREEHRSGHELLRIENTIFSPWTCINNYSEHG